MMQPYSLNNNTSVHYIVQVIMLLYYIVYLGVHK